MSNEVFLTSIKNLRPHLLTFGARISFGKIFKTIFKSKNVDFVIVKKAQTNQMAAVLLTRLLGSKFVWVQNFSNPPIPSFLAGLLLSQADHIMATNKKDVEKLLEIGINKRKIHRSGNLKLKI